MFAGSPVYAAMAIAVPLVLLLLLLVSLLSIHRIGPNEVGLVIRRWGPGRAQGDFFRLALGQMVGKVALEIEGGVL